MTVSNDIIADKKHRQDNVPLIEARSIDYIPESERHGTLSSQFTLWFGANLQITAIVTGALAVVLGGDVFWSLIGLFIGQLLGGAVMALHAVQGPKLGLPQMISSRVQFGVYGAVIPILLVCMMYVGFSRPTHLLCFAVRKRRINNIDVYKDNGWAIVDLTKQNI